MTRSPAKECVKVSALPHCLCRECIKVSAWAHCLCRESIKVITLSHCLCRESIKVSAWAHCLCQESIKVSALTHCLAGEHIKALTLPLSWLWKSEKLPDYANYLLWFYFCGRNYTQNIQSGRKGRNIYTHFVFANWGFVRNGNSFFAQHIGYF